MPRRGWGLEKVSWVYAAMGFGVALFFFTLGPAVLDLNSLLPSVVTVLIGTPVLFFALWRVSAEKRRHSLFRLPHYPGLIALGFGISVVMLAMSYFAAVTFLLYELNLVEVNFAPYRSCVCAMTHFYLWHFLDAVPAIEIPDALNWRVPVTYTGSWMGILVVGLKVLIIFPLLQTWRGYWKYHSEKRETP
jgi:hypothetical protein